MLITEICGFLNSSSIHSAENFIEKLEISQILHFARSDKVWIIISEFVLLST